jgi:small subunit ribosomal protein S20
MPIIKSAIKRMRQTVRKTKKNEITKRLLKEISKKFIAFIEAGKNADAVKLYPMLQKKIDMAVKKNLMHANKAARQKSRYAKMLKADAKPAKKTVTKKPVAKKTAKKEEK